MRRLEVTIAIVVGVMLAGCADPFPQPEALGDLSPYGSVVISERSCDEGGDDCTRHFLFEEASLTEVVAIVTGAGFPIDPSRPIFSVRPACKDGEPLRCAIIVEFGDNYRVTLHEIR